MTIASLAEKQRNASQLEVEEHSLALAVAGKSEAYDSMHIRDVNLSTSIAKIYESERRESLKRRNSARTRRQLHVNRLRAYIHLNFPHLAHMTLANSTWEQRMMKRHHTRKMAVSHANWLSLHTVL